MDKVDQNNKWENAKITVLGKQIDGIVNVAYDGENKSIYDTKVYSTKRGDGTTVIILEKKIPTGSYETIKFSSDPIVIPIGITEAAEKELITSIINEFETCINEKLKSPSM